MRHTRILVGAFVSLSAVSAAVAFLQRGSFFAPTPAEQWTLVKTYCADCHSQAEASGGLVLEGRAAADVAHDPKTFEAVIRKLRGRLMPPPGNPQPEQKRLDSFVAWLEHSIDDGAHSPRAGHVPIQRLNRSEYAASVADLVGVEIHAADFLPSDIEVDGFDNIAAALSVSPTFLEQYIAVARHVAHLAVGEPRPKVASVSFPQPEGDQDAYVDGMPLGTRGGVRFAHDFLADGEYRVTLTDLDVGLYPRSLETEQTVVVLLDRKEMFRGKLGGREDLALVNRGGAPGRAEIMQRFANIPMAVTAGVHEVVVTFIERSRASTDGLVRGFMPYGGFSFTGEVRAPRVLGGVEVKGPFGSTGLSQTASRAKIFTCTPENAGEERPCATRIAELLAQRAYRRRVDGNDVEHLLAFYDAGRTAGTFDAGVEQLVTAILASPDFLYRAVTSADGDKASFALGDYELASRLSFFLWNQGPDDELLRLAAAGKLGDPAVMGKQVDRMLADERAHALVSGFALQWLNVDELDAVIPDKVLFPEFSNGLRTDFAQEIDLFVTSVLLGNRNVQELLTADYTFVNERLARHYGINDVRGPQFRRVTVTDEARRGLLGKGAVLLRTSYGDRTSPVLRGAWVLDKLMGTPPSPPPPNVVTDLSTPTGSKPTTIRARLERHRSDPTCKGCHGVIDPYGFALENFSATGQWRDVDRVAGEPIDATSELPGGRALDGPKALREALLAHPDQFVQALTKKLLMYGLGRELEYFDMPQVRAIVRAAARDDYRFATLVKGVVASDAFRFQTAPIGHADAATTAQAARD